MKSRTQNPLTRTVQTLVHVVAFSTIIGFGNAPAQAFQIFFGEDLHNSPSVPLSSTPNASAAESNFLSNLVVGVGTEDFDGLATHTVSPLNLLFPGSTGNITTTLSGGGGWVKSVSVGSALAGRYGTSGTNFWQVAAGPSNNFQVDFNTAIGAFGFYGIDIGDFGGQLVLELSLSGGTTQQFTAPNTQGSVGSTDGSVLFFGIVAQNASETFTSIEFLTTTGHGDVFGFDDFTIADIQQTRAATPEPALILGLLLVGGAGSMLKRIE